MVHSKCMKQAGGPATNGAATAEVVKGELPILRREVMGQVSALSSAIGDVNAHPVAVFLFPDPTLFWIVWLAPLVFSIELAQKTDILIAPSFMCSVGAILAVSLVLLLALLTCILESVWHSFASAKIFVRGRFPFLAPTAPLGIGYPSIYGGLSLHFFIRRLFSLGTLRALLLRWLASSACVVQSGRRRVSAPKVFFGSLKMLSANSALLELDRGGLNPALFFLLVISIHSLAGFACSTKIAKGAMSEISFDSKEFFGSRLLFSANATYLKAISGGKLLALGESSARYADIQETVSASNVPMKVFSCGRQPVLTFAALLLGYIWSMIAHGISPSLTSVRAAGLLKTVAAVSYCVDLNYSTFTRNVQLQGAYT